MIGEIIKDNNLFKYFGLLFIAVIIASSTVILTNYFLFVFAFILICFICYLKNEKIIISTIIISYLTTLTEFVGEIRIYSNIFFTSILFYFFLKKYGFNLKKYPKIPFILIYFIVFYLFTLFLSASFSEYKLLGIYSIITTVFFLVIVYVLFALVIYYNDLSIIIYSIIVSDLIISIRMFADIINLGIENFYKKSIIQSNIDLYGSINYTGFTILFISIPILISYITLKSKSKILMKILYFFVLISLVTTLILSNSRALAIATIISVVIYFSFTNRKILKRIIISFIIVIILFFTIPLLSQLIELYFRVETISQREVLWQSGIEVINKYPILGIGPRTFPYYFFSTAPSYIFEVWTPEVVFNSFPQPHNLFLYYWAENGVLGFVTIIYFFFIFIFLAIKTLSNSKGKNSRRFIIASCSLSIICGMLFRAFFEVSGVLSYGYITIDLPFWLVLIMLIISVKSSEDKSIILSV